MVEKAVGDTEAARNAFSSAIDINPSSAASFREWATLELELATQLESAARVKHESAAQLRREIADYDDDVRQHKYFACRLHSVHLIKTRVHYYRLTQILMMRSRVLWRRAIA